MVPRHRDDSRRIAERPEDESSDTRSRVFVWGDPVEEPSLFRKLANRLRRAGPEVRPSEPSPTVVRPAVGRRMSSEPVRSEPAPPSPNLGAEEGWDPPDLTVDAPPASPPPTPSSHGPGPLYRATLQLLPGRLRPLDPDIVREEIRFVRPPGEEAAVTLGWAEGEPPGHITVNHPSVQDRHARMSFVDRRWRIESLVASHPVRVNDEALPAGGEPRELQSGDEVRLGDATFHFLMP